MLACHQWMFIQIPHNKLPWSFASFTCPTFKNQDAPHREHSFTYWMWPFFTSCKHPHMDHLGNELMFWPLLRNRLKRFCISNFVKKKYSICEYLRNIYHNYIYIHKNISLRLLTPQEWLFWGLKHTPIKKPGSVTPSIWRILPRWFLGMHLYIKPRMGIRETGIFSA